MSTDALSLPDDPAALKALLLRERKRFDSEREQHQQTLAHYEQTVADQQQQLGQLQHRLMQLLRRLYGPKQERFDPRQLTLFDGEELAALTDEFAREQEPDDAGTSTRKRRRKGHGRRPLPAHLPREECRHELPDEDRACPCCGETRAEVGSETSEQLEFIPASLKVIRHVRVKYACRRCGEHVAVAAKVPQPIEKGLPGPGLLAQVVLSKYGDHTPLYRQEDILARHGITLRRSTLCDWIAAAADLARPLYERMCALVRQSKVIHTDDTTVPLLDATVGHARSARFWIYIGDGSHPYWVYDFTDSRRRDGPLNWLDGFRGYLQADAYGGYDGLYLDPGRNIIEVACWAHTRRYWWESKSSDARRAHHALAFVARLYQVESDAKELSSADRCAVRQERSRPILEEFRAWLDAEREQVLPKSPAGTALRYTENQWEALNRYLDDGDLSIDNNVAERGMKTPALGRKNWLFVASRAGGHRAALLMSLVASAKANQVEPWAWLREVFARLPLLGPSPSAEELSPLLPDRWLETHPEHRWHIADQRKAERTAKQR
jgi:transposase